MSIPLNLIHFYIGAPILAYISIHGLFFTRNKNNIVTRYFAWATGVYAIAACIYALPVLFTHDSDVLTLTTVIADIVQYISLGIVGLLATHLSLTRWPWVRRAANLVIFLASLVFIYVSYHENTAFPAQFVMMDGVAHFEYVSTRTYSIMTGFAFSPLLFVGLSFLMQVREAMRTSQKYRIAGFGVFLAIVGLVMVVAPIFRFDIATTAVTIPVVVAFVLMTILLMLSYLTSQKEPKA
jgi:peptidoglycan/LPS O-acetylase OafA/YrhL